MIDAQLARLEALAAAMPEGPYDVEQEYEPDRMCGGEPEPLGTYYLAVPDPDHVTEMMGQYMPERIARFVQAFDRGMALALVQYVRAHEAAVEAYSAFYTELMDVTTATDSEELLALSQANTSARDAARSAAAVLRAVLIERADGWSIG